jgi:hypothetical protein
LIDSKKYQAILPFPLFQTGSENKETLLTKDVDASIENALSASAQTSLPIIGSALSRTSASQARLVTSLLRDGIDREPFLSPFEHERPILLLVTGRLSVELSQIEGAKVIAQEDTTGPSEVTLIEIPVMALKTITLPQKPE